MRRFRIDVGPVAVLSLSALFTALVVAVLVSGAGVYKRSQERGQAALQSAAVRGYLSVKMRQSDAAGLVPSVVDMGGTPVADGPALALYEEIDGERYRTVVYQYGGMLLELFQPDGLSFRPGDGERVMELSSLSFTDTGKGIRVVAESPGGQVHDFYVGFACGGKADAVPSDIGDGGIDIGGGEDGQE